MYCSTIILQPVERKNTVLDTYPKSLFLFHRLYNIIVLQYIVYKNLLSLTEASQVAGFLTAKLYVHVNNFG